LQNRGSDARFVADGNTAGDTRFVIHNENALWFYGLFMFAAAWGHGLDALAWVIFGYPEKLRHQE